MEDMINILSNVGFPIAIALYLLVRFENKLTQLNDSINNLSNIIQNSFQDWFFIFFNIKIYTHRT